MKKTPQGPPPSVKPNRKNNFFGDERPVTANQQLEELEQVVNEGNAEDEAYGYEYGDYGEYGQEGYGQEAAVPEEKKDQEKVSWDAEDK